MKRSSSREEGELQAPTRHRGPSIPSASRSCSAVAAARNNGIRMGSLSSYTLLKKVGGGAFGVVRMARHRHSGKVVAIKSPRTGGYHELLREASLLTACHGNPAIVKLREVACGFDPDDFHLVMEFVGPKDLHDVLIQRRRHGRLFTEEETCGLMRQLLAGVERMHALGVVHCDLKPGNVLVCKHDGRLKICDFGHAISMSEPAPPGAELQGTPTYMAPELLLGGNDRVPGIDMWSLGCVMAEIMTGKPIFHEVDNEVELAMQIIRFLGIPDDVSEFPLLVSTSSKLRDILREERLSQPGFDVLSGLLEYNPKTRLTATTALLMPWFSPESNDPPSPGKDMN